MKTVKHKLYGEGQVVSRNGNTIVVKFANDVEKKFAIPQSFQLGIMTAEGELKNEIENIIKQKETVKNNTTVSDNKPQQSVKKSAKVEVVGQIATGYETYLIRSGYKTQTDKGLPSTVYAYIKAVDFVLDEEHLTWSALVDKIHIVIKKYDVGGEKEHLGNKSNKTVINALKRFQDYVNQM